MICDWGSKVYVFFNHKKIGAFCMKFVPIISYKTNGTPWPEQIMQKNLRASCMLPRHFSGIHWQIQLAKTRFWQAGFPAQITILVFQQLSLIHI